MVKRQKEDLNEALNSAEKSVRKKGVVYGDNPMFKENRLSTGFFVLDRMLEGGLLRGVFYCFFGAYGQGKTTLAYSFISSAQKIVPDGKFALIDMEHRFSSDYAQRLGIVVENLEIYRPEFGEDALDKVKELILDRYDIIVIDSIAALSEEKIVTTKMAQDTMGSKARMLSKFFEKTIPYNENTVVIFLNQLRKNIGGVTNPGALKTMPGGEALKHYCRLIAEVTRNGWLPSKDVGETKYDGFNIHVHISKSTISVPQRFCDIPFNFVEGKINEIAATTDLAIMKKLVTQAGAWYSYGEEKMMGKNNVTKYFEENPDKYEKLKNQITNSNLPVEEQEEESEIKEEEKK